MVIYVAGARFRGVLTCDKRDNDLQAEKMGGIYVTIDEITSLIQEPTTVTPPAPANNNSQSLRILATPTMTRRTIATSNRPVFGPLTTVFTPSPDCNACYVYTSDLPCVAYSTNCEGARPCMPDSNWDPSGLYSPGVHCPSGWTTATVLSANDSQHIAPDKYNRLLPDETAAFCCPE